MLNLKGILNYTENALSHCPVKEKLFKRLAKAFFFIYSVNKWVKVVFCGNFAGRFGCAHLPIRPASFLFFNHHPLKRDFKKILCFAALHH